MKTREKQRVISTACGKLSRGVYQFLSRLGISATHAGMIISTLFQLHNGNKLAQRFLKTVWEIILENVCHDKKTAHWFLKMHYNFFVTLHWQVWLVFNEVLKITWKHGKQMKVELQICKHSLQQSAVLRVLLVSYVAFSSLRLFRNFSGPDSLIFCCTAWYPHVCKQNLFHSRDFYLLTAAVYLNPLLNERPLAFETVFFF